MLQYAYASIETIENCKSWLCRAKDAFNQSENVQQDISLPLTRPLLVNRKQMLAVFMSISSFLRTITDSDSVLQLS